MYGKYTGCREWPAVWLHLDAESLRAVNHMIVVNATGSHKLYIFIVIYIWQCLFSQFEAYLIKHYSTLVKMTFVWSTPHHVHSIYIYMYRWKLTITTTWTSQKLWGLFMMTIEKWNIPFAKKTDVRVFLLANPFLQSNHLQHFTTCHRAWALAQSSVMGGLKNIHIIKVTFSGVTEYCKISWNSWIHGRFGECFSW